MKIEIFLYVGAAFHLAWAVFDFFWPRVFNWKETLASLDDFQRVLLPITSRLLVVLYLAIAYVSVFHPVELVTTDLGRSILTFVSAYWAVRAVLQIRYFGFERANTFNVSLASYAPHSALKGISNKTVSLVFLMDFILISALYFIPSVCGT